MAESLDGLVRCWGAASLGSLSYHDGQWGRAAHFFPTAYGASSDWLHLSRLYALQCLELMQAGLSWRTILGKWAAFSAAFCSWDVRVVAEWGEADALRLMQDAGIVRHRGKIEACMQNARLIASMERAEPHSFITLLSFHAPHAARPHHRIHRDERVLASGQHLPSYMRTDYTTKPQQRTACDGVHPSITVHLLAQALRQAGFKFMGDTVVLSFMQAVGLMNHHEHSCFAFSQCEEEYERVRQAAEAHQASRRGLTQTETNEAAEAATEAGTEQGGEAADEAEQSGKKQRKRKAAKRSKVNA